MEKVQTESLNKKSIELFNSFKKSSPLGESILINLEEQDSISFTINQNIWDSNEKDYCFDMLFYDRANATLYFYPQACESNIPLIDAKLLMELLVKENFNIEVQFSKENIDRFFQTLKLNENSQDNIKYLKELINKSISVDQKSNLGKLLYGTSKKIIRLEDENCNKLFYRFTQFIITVIKLYSQAISSLKNNTDNGLLNSTIHIQGNLQIFYQTELWKKLREIYGIYNEEIIRRGVVLGMFKELSTNIIFNPNVQYYLNRALLPIEDIEKKIENIERIQLSEYGDNIFMQDKEEYKVIEKVLNIADMLNTYEASIYQINIDSDSLNNIELQNYFVYRQKQLITLIDLNKIKKIYMETSYTDEIINKALDKISKSDELYIDTSVYILPRRMIDIMTGIFSKYFV